MRIILLLASLAGLSALTSCKGGAVGELATDAGVDAGGDATPPDGSDWELVYEGPDPGAQSALHAMWASGPDDVWAVGKDRAVVHWDGKSWEALVPVSGQHLYGVWGASKTEVVAVGANAFDLSPAVLNYDGDLWTSGAPFADGMTGLTDVWGIGTQRYFTGLEGHIYQDDPVKFPLDRYHTAVITGGCPDVNDPAPNLNAIDAEDLGNILAAGDRALIAHKDAQGWARFCAQDPKVDYSAVFHVPGSQSFFLGSNFLGILLWLGRSEPLLQIHENLALPDADKAYVQGISGDAQRIVAVGDHGTVLYYDNGPNGALPLSSPTTDSLYGVVFIPPQLYVCGTRNRIWRRVLE